MSWKRISTMTTWSAMLALSFAVQPIQAQPDQETHLVLCWNDLGMHCMNKNHNKISVLPPYNTLQAQVILRGSGSAWPEIVTAGITVEYSIPGNTYSVGKTDFWTYVYQLFGVNLPPNIGLTGKGLTGTMDPGATYFIAEGIPITPFPDATPTIEDPYQQALIIARDALGTELAESHPVIPTSVEMSCVSAGCHSSEQQILNMHEQVPGFNPANPPIMCAWCHADPVLGMPGSGDADYFSKVMHEKHEFIDQQIPGLDGCYKCHPGPNTRCLRCTMSTSYGMVCQDCHGTMAHVASTIDGGRIPWVEEPACRTCHTAQYGEPVGQLYRHSAGHGGVYCAACHGSPHATFPSRVARDNANNIALQGYAGTLRDCRVCHGVWPSGPGPHGLASTGVIENEILGGAQTLDVQPSVVTGTCTISFAASDHAEGRLIVYDELGRVQRLLRPTPAGPGRWRAEWDAMGRGGQRVERGVYFVRWEGQDERAAAKVLVTR
jgi:hypothetical protein